jgi:hypothetical protein
MTWLNRTVRAGAMAFATLLAAVAAHAQTPAGPPASTGLPVRALDAEARAVVVEAAAAALRSRYVFPDVAEEAAAAIEAALADGAYDEISGPWPFADRLTEDLQAVSNDKHMRVAARAPRPPVDIVGPGASPPAAPPPSEAGIVRADRLADDVGYIEVAGFPSPDVFAAVVDRAMAPLADTRALIVDIRRNGGGSPVSVSHLVSYFLEGDEPVLINTFLWRNPDTETFRTDEFWSAPTPFSYAGKPVYVLTSDYTFSGGEEFAYDMQVLDLGVLVGSVTGGGANPGGGAPLGPDFTMFLPGGRAENPITKTNWEGVGVIPDIETPVADALKVALAELGVATEETGIDALSEARVFEPRATADPRSEAAVRRTIDELVRGEPDYARMSEQLADLTRRQLTTLQGIIAPLGAVESVAFREVGPQGADVYDVTFEEGALTWSIALDADGRTVLAGFRLAPPPPQP